MRFSCMTSRLVRVDIVTSVYFSGMENVSFFGTLGNSRVSVMRINEVTLDRPKVIPCFCVICGFCRLSLFRSASTSSHEVFTRYGLFSPQSGFKEFAISPWQVCRTIRYWKDKLFSRLWYQYFFRIDSSRINFWCVQPVPRKEWSVPKACSEMSFVGSSPIRQEVMEVFVGSKNITLNQPTIFIQSWL